MHDVDFYQQLLQQLEAGKSEAKTVYCRIVRAKRREISAGMSRNPNAISGPTLSTATESSGVYCCVSAVSMSRRLAWK